MGGSEDHTGGWVKSGDVYVRRRGEIEFSHRHEGDGLMLTATLVPAKSPPYYEVIPAEVIESMVVLRVDK